MVEFKVNVSFASWPYEESMSVTLTPEDLPKIDTMIDSLISNLKVRLLFHIKNNHPTVWHKDTKLDTNLIEKLKL